MCFENCDFLIEKWKMEADGELIRKALRLKEHISVFNPPLYTFPPLNERETAFVYWNNLTRCPRDLGPGRGALR